MITDPLYKFIYIYAQARAFHFTDMYIYHAAQKFTEAVSPWNCPAVQGGDAPQHIQLKVIARWMMGFLL